MDIGTVIQNIGQILQKYWRTFLIEGVTNTLLLTAIAVSIGAVIGVFVTLLKRSRFRVVRFLITVYIEVIRGTPILLQLYLFYFVLPELLPFFNLSAFAWVAIALSINSSAYVSEVFRSGIQAVDPGQTEAARSLGMSKGQTMVRIVLPQAIKNILPALGNEFIMILKETSLASTFFIGDLMTSYKVVSGATYLSMEPLIIVGVVYLCLTYPLSKLVAFFERRMAHGNN
ncbi:MAG: amino acid ABC transporter permease [Faecousia sp.]